MSRRRQVENKQVIAIEQTDPNTVYVPYYDPAVVYARGRIRHIRPITSRPRAISREVFLPRA